MPLAAAQRTCGPHESIVGSHCNVIEIRSRAVEQVGNGDVSDCSDFVPLPNSVRSVSDAREDPVGPVTTERLESAEDAFPLIRVSHELESRRFEILQQWEGIVDETTPDSVWAEIRDLTEPRNPPEAVEIPLVEFPPSDRELLAPGAVFYWAIGYDTSPGGQIRRVSELRARRTPLWSKHALDVVRKAAAEMAEQFEDACGK